MDVELPDGSVVEGVPDGMSQRDLVSLLSKNGHDTSWYKEIVDRIKSAFTSSGSPGEESPQGLDTNTDALALGVTNESRPLSVMDGFQSPEPTGEGMPIDRGMGPMRQDYYDTTRSGLLGAPLEAHGRAAQSGGQVGKVARDTLPDRLDNLERDLSGDTTPRTQQELKDDTEASLRVQPLRTEEEKKANRQWLTENSKAAIEGIKRYTKMDQADAEAELEQMLKYGVKPAWVDDSMPKATLGQSISANFDTTGPALQKALLGLSEAAADQPFLQLPWKDYAKRTPRELESMVNDLDKRIRAGRNVGGKIESGSWNDVVSSMGPSLATNLPPLMAASLVAARNPAAGMAIASGGLGVMGMQKFGDTYLKGQMKGLSAGDNLAYASLAAAAEVIPEKLSLNALFAVFKTMGKGAAVETIKAFAKQQLTEHTTEQITTIADHLIDKAYTEPDKSLESLWKEMKQTAMATAIQAPLLAGGGMLSHGVGQAAVAAKQKYDQSRDITAGMGFDPNAIDAAARGALNPARAQMEQVGRAAPPVVPTATPADVGAATTPEAASTAIAEIGASLPGAAPISEVLEITQAEIDALLADPITESAALPQTTDIAPPVAIESQPGAAAAGLLSGPVTPFDPFLAQGDDGRWKLSRPIDNQPPEFVSALIDEMDFRNTQPQGAPNAQVQAQQGAPTLQQVPQAAPEAGALPSQLKVGDGDAAIAGAVANDVNDTSVSDSFKSLPDYAQQAIGEHHMEQVTNRKVHPGLINAEWEKVDVPVESLKEKNALHFDTNKQREYAGRKIYNAGPVILDRNGELIDGNHRFNKAVRDGQSTIEAYRPRRQPPSTGESPVAQPSGTTAIDTAIPKSTTAIPETQAQPEAIAVAGDTAIAGNAAPKAITRIRGGKLEITGFDKDEVVEVLKTAKIVATVTAGKDGRILVSVVDRAGNPEKMPIKVQNAITKALLPKDAEPKRPRRFTGNLRNDVNLIAPGLYAEVARGGGGEGMDGIDMSLVAEKLRGEGFMLPTTETGKDSDAVIELIRQDIANGGGTLNERRQTETMDSEAKKEARTEMLRLANEYGVETRVGIAWRAADAVLSEIEAAITKEIGILGRDVASITKDGVAAGAFTAAEAKQLAIDIATGYRGDQKRDARVIMYREIAEQLQERINEHESAASREAGGRSGEGAGTEAEAEARPALELAGQSEAEARADEERITAAEAQAWEEESRAAAAERQARIDAEVASRQDVAADNFTLDAQVNDRAAQRAADKKRIDDQLAGQGDIFAPKPANPLADAADAMIKAAEAMKAAVAQQAAPEAGKPAETEDRVKTLLRNSPIAANGDVYAVAGDRNAGIRQEIMSAILGKKATKQESGITALREALWAMAEVPDGTIASKDDALRAWISGKPAATKEQSAEFKDALDAEHENGVATGNAAVVRSKQDLEAEHGIQLTNAQVDELNAAYQSGVAVSDEIEGKEPATKEPWQMRRDDWVDGHIKSPGMHREHVRQAIARGDSVPTEVLTDYPDLTTKESESDAPFDSKAFDKARDERVKASKAAGNKHLDQVTPSVETMRGREIYYAHNPQQRGVIRTVDNRGNVYVYWADKYSADKELASEIVEDNKSWLKSSKAMPYMREVRDGKTYVFESSLGTSDLKDYVFVDGANPAQQPAEPHPNERPETTPKPPAENLDAMFDDILAEEAKATPARELTIDDVPPARLKKITVAVDAVVGDEIESMMVPAEEALADVEREISAFKLLLDCVKGK